MNLKYRFNTLSNPTTSRPPPPCLEQRFVQHQLHRAPQQAGMPGRADPRSRLQQRHPASISPGPAAHPRQWAVRERVAALGGGRAIHSQSKSLPLFGWRVGRFANSTALLIGAVEKGLMRRDKVTAIRPETTKAK